MLMQLRHLLFAVKIPDAAQAAQWAVETGLMTPKSADLFKPEKSVTRWKAIRSWKRVTNQNT